MTWLPGFLTVTEVHSSLKKAGFGFLISFWIGLSTQYHWDPDLGNIPHPKKPRLHRVLEILDAFLFAT